MPAKYHRRVVRITGRDSPNVRLAEAEIEKGLKPSYRTLVPGVLTYDEYVARRKTWDPIRQCIGLDAQWYMGAQVMMYPPLWLAAAANPERIRRCRAEPAEAIGVDPAEGGDSTTLAAVNRYGVKDLRSHKTPDTSVILTLVKAFGLEHDVPSTNWLFDRGGGGKQLTDLLESDKEHRYRPRTVAFGEPVKLEIKRGLHLTETRIDTDEERYAYVSRRVELYHDLRRVLDPSINEDGFGIPYGPDVSEEFKELRRQMEAIPLEYDQHGRLWLPPKNPPPMTPETDYNDPKRVVSLREMLGCSPDELEAVCLGLHGILHKPRRAVAGTVVGV